MVRGADFPVEASVDRARELAAQCDGWGMVEVWALTETAVATRASCKPDDETHHTVLLNDQTLPAIDDPISAATITTVWSEIAAAGLDEHLIRVEIDRGRNQAAVFFTGFDRDLTYQWSRGLTEPNSRVMSHPTEPPVAPTLGAVSVEQLTAAFDEALSGLDDPSAAERIEVGPTPDGESLHLVLAALDYTTLAMVPIEA